MFVGLGLIWLSGCGADPSGDWSGERTCAGDPAQAMEVSLVAKGGYWHGPGRVEWGDTDLGEQVLHFDLELRHSGRDWESDLFRCTFEWAADAEDTPCLDAQLTYDVEDDPVVGTQHLLTGTLGGCPVFMTMD